MVSFRNIEPDKSLRGMIPNILDFSHSNTRMEVNSSVNRKSRLRFNGSFLSSLIFALVMIGMASVIFHATGGTAAGMDLSLCASQPETLSDRIRCRLWDIIGYMHTKETSDTRTTGKIVLSPERWASAEISTWMLRSSWPDSIRIRIYQHTEGDDRLVEDILDEGVNGLDPDEGDDKYQRYNAKRQAVDLLADRDKETIKPVNEEYINILEQLLDVLKQPGEVFEPFEWRLVAEGLEMARPKARRFIRLGREELIMLRFDPAMYYVVPYSFAESENYVSAGIQRWSERIPEALALINSGQYYPDDRYIGLQVKDGKDWGTGLHSRWKAILLSGLLPGHESENAPPGKILDLQYESFDPVDSPYRYVLQSFMLLDQRGAVRVRSSDRLASRSVIAQDRQGRLLLMVAPGACSLYELALLLKQSDLQIMKAMSLDGGIESQVLIRTPSGKEVVSGEWSIDERRQYRYVGPSPSLPAVLAVLPKSRAR